MVKLNIKQVAIAGLQQNVSTSLSKRTRLNQVKMRFMGLDTTLLPHTHSLNLLSLKLKKIKTILNMNNRILIKNLISKMDIWKMIHSTMILL